MVISNLNTARILELISVRKSHKEKQAMYALRPESIPQQLALPLKRLARILGVFH